RATGNGDLGRLAIAAGSYVVSAKIGLSLSVAHGSATPVWAPTGISLAALLLFGKKVWPAVFVGAFLANSMTPVPISLAFAIAVGNTAEALLGWFLLTRIGFRNGLDRVHDVIALVVGAAVLSTAVTATVPVPTTAVEAFQALFGFVGVTLLIVAATTSERAVAEETLAERERLQEQMRKALDRERDAANELRSLDEMKTTFLHAVSHDLRTPLASIFGLAVTLQRDDVQLVVDDRRDLAERI